MGSLESEERFHITPEDVGSVKHEQLPETRPEETLSYQQRAAIERDGQKGLETARRQIQNIPGGVPSVRYAPPEEMGSDFGWSTNPPTVRSDLPPSVQAFVRSHEEYHLRDSPKNWLWGEIKANVAGAVQHPIGFLRTAWMSLTSKERLKLYADRFRKGY